MKTERAQPDSPRRRNVRGEGGRLRGDIVAAALALVEREGGEEAVTLRAVAREAGIAAPSIYAHFPDRDAVLVAAVLLVFDELTAAIRQGAERGGLDPVARLVGGCRAYLDFGLDHPHRYGVLFSEERLAARDACRPVPIGPDGRPVLEFGAESFALLVDSISACVEAGLSSSTDVVADGTAIWVALHGMVELRSALPGFPWPETSSFVANLVCSLAHVDAVPPAPPRAR